MYVASTPFEWEILWNLWMNPECNVYSNNHEFKRMQPYVCPSTTSVKLCQRLVCELDGVSPELSSFDMRLRTASTFTETTVSCCPATNQRLISSSFSNRDGLWKVNLSVQDEDERVNSTWSRLLRRWNVINLNCIINFDFGTISFVGLLRSMRSVTLYCYDSLKTFIYANCLHHLLELKFLFG